MPPTPTPILFSGCRLWLLDALCVGVEWLRFESRFSASTFFRQFSCLVFPLLSANKSQFSSPVQKPSSVGLGGSADEAVDSVFFRCQLTRSKNLENKSRAL